MKFKKILLITLLLLAVFTISSVSAADNLTDEGILQDTSSEEIELSENTNEEVIETPASNEELSRTITVEGNTFSDIQTAIDNAKSGDIIKLHGTYTYDGGFAINIDTDNLTIDGENNAILDGNNEFRMIHVINGANILIKNIKFINGYGGAIRVSYANCVIDNCQFIDCAAYEERGGAIYIEYLDTQVNNCVFENCNGLAGSAIYVAELSYGIAHNCVFKKCSATAGGIISADEEYSSFDVYNCVFENNNGPLYSGNVYIFNDEKDVKANTLSKKLTPKIIAKKATFKVKTKTKKYSAILKTNKNKAMKKVKVYLKVKGKTYTAKTNSNGKAIFKIKNLKKKGTYKATVTFKGNNNFSKATKTVKITVK